MSKSYFEECKACTVPHITGTKLAMPCPGNGSVILLCQKLLAEVYEQKKTNINGNQNK